MTTQICLTLLYPALLYFTLLYSICPWSLRNSADKSDSEGVPGNAYFAGNRIQIAQLGPVKKRSQSHSAYQHRFFVLRADALYYYASEREYFFYKNNNKDQNEEALGGCKGAVPIADIKASRGTPAGVFIVLDGWQGGGEKNEACRKE